MGELHWGGPGLGGQLQRACCTVETNHPFHRAVHRAVHVERSCGNQLTSSLTQSCTFQTAMHDSEQTLNVTDLTDVAMSDVASKP